MRQIAILHILTIGFVLATSSCNNKNEKKSDKHCIQSFEMAGTSGHDTINRIDCGGKQGIWVSTTRNKLKDTIYYRNDTIVSKCILDTFTFAGIYKGKNIFCQSLPKDSTALKTILLNDKEIASTVSTALFEISLSSLKVGEKFIVKIISCKEKKSTTKIINLNELTPSKKELRATNSNNS
jgi:hypothetical protein